MKKLIVSLGIMALAAVPAYAKDGRVNPNHPGPAPGVQQNQNTHVGQTDTDGTLSPGERKNPNIDYGSTYYDRTAEDRAYQQHLRDIESRERELAYEEDSRRHDRSWWDW
jgi:hypothetical protein